MAAAAFGGGNSAANGANDLFAGGGLMGRRMAATDWSATPLGPPDRWPLSLRTAVRIILMSRYPMFAWWGPDLINLYNDAYIPVLGARHPAALGRPAPEIWAEIWPVVGPRAASVLNKGEATLDRDLLLMMERYGAPEETYFTFSYSPLPDDSGAVGGVFCACTEETQKVVGQRRLALLRELAADTAECRSERDACTAAAAALARDRFDLPFAALYLADGDGMLRLSGLAGFPAEHPACPATVPAASDSPWSFSDVLATGEARVIEGLSTRFHDLPTGAWERPPERAIVLPLSASGHDRPAGAVVLGLNPMRPLDEEIRGFAGLVAGQIAAAVATARAYAEERRRAEALAEIDRAKTAFFSNVSHEFRTPLTLLLGPLEEALALPGDTPAAAAQEHLAVAHRNGLRLLRLVNALLDFARIEAGRTEAAFEPVDLAALTADLAGNFRSACQHAGLTLTVDAPPLPQPVYVDGDMWEKILLNLLSNAFKFTLRGGIAVTVRARGAAAEISVRDTGIGIPPAELPRLFERFHRIEGARGRSVEGTGIGLALVQELVTLHGGAITVDSAPDRGSTFTVTLPFGTGHLPHRPRVGQESSPAARFGLNADAFVEEAVHWLPDPAAAPADGPPRPEPPADAGGVPGEGGRVLLADDNADMRNYLRRLLQSHYAVEAVADGTAALAAARRERPDLVVTDVMMPGLDGFALLRALRAEPTTRDVPVILLSARAGEEARVEGLSAGADDYLTKPFAARELVARVRVNLELARQRRIAAEAVRASDARFAAVVEQATAGLSQIDTEGRFTAANEFFCRLVGRAENRLAGVRVHDVVHPDDLGRTLSLIARAVETGVPFTAETRFLRPDGRVVCGENAVAPLRDRDGRVDRLLAVTVDVTDRKRAEAALRESEERLRLALDATGLGTWDVDPPTGRRRWSAEFKRILGLPPEMAADYELFERLIHPEDRDRVVGNYRAAFGPGQRGGHEDEFRIRRADDGEERWVHVRGRVHRDGDGRAVRAVGTLLDVTDRRRAEEALRARQGELETVLATVPAAVWFTRDPEGRRIQGNHHAIRLFGPPPGAADGQPTDVTICRDGVPVPPGSLPVQQALAGTEVRGQELEVRFADGASMVVLANAMPLRDDAGRVVGAVGASIDISERKLAEERQKLLLAELNHRVKNTLATVQSVAQQTLRSAPSPQVFIETFTGRLLALSQTHDLLTREAWHGASLGHVVQRTLAPYIARERHRATIGGPDLRLGPNAAVTLSMAFHELTTNAIKYGALSHAQGRIDVTWSIHRDTGGATVDVCWTESGGPPVAPPPRRGFGSRLIEQGVARELNAVVQLDFAPSGLSCRMRLPISNKVMLP